MSYKLTYIQEPEYIHVVVTGLNTRENVARYLEETQNECTSRGCTRVLIEERLEGPRLGPVDVFELAAEASDRAVGKFDAIAYVDVNAKDNMMEFAETVAVNRFLPVRVFFSVSDAEKWLLREVRGGTQPSTPAEA